MEKDFQQWNNRKTWINNKKPRAFFNERDVWWCSMGINIGFEQDGKGQQFSRPILVFKKFNNEIFWGIPLTTKVKENKFYLPISLKELGQQAVIVSQMRLIDSKRLLAKLSYINKEDYLKIKKAVIALCEL